MDVREGFVGSFFFGYGTGGLLVRVFGFVEVVV